MVLPPEADELFRVPPSGFIAARNALVARLREEDRNDEAAPCRHCASRPPWCGR